MNGCRGMLRFRRHLLGQVRRGLGGASPSASATTSCATGADAIVGGDLGCLLNIEGKLRRMGDETTRVLHVAEVLTGKD